MDSRIVVRNYGRTAVDPDSGATITVNSNGNATGGVTLSVLSQDLDPSEIDPLHSDPVPGSAPAKAEPVSQAPQAIPASFQKDVEEYRKSPGLKSFDQFTREKYGKEGSGAGSVLKDLFDAASQYTSSRPAELGGYDLPAAARIFGPGIGTALQKAYGALGGDATKNAVQRWQEEQQAQPSSLGDVFSGDTWKTLGKGMADVVTDQSKWWPTAKGIVNDLTDPENLLANSLGLVGGEAVGMIPRVAAMKPLVKAATKAAANAGSNAAVSGISSPTSQGFDPVAAAQGAVMGLGTEAGMGLARKILPTRKLPKLPEVDQGAASAEPIDWYAQSDLASRHPDVKDRDVKLFNTANQELAGSSPTNGYDVLSNPNSATRQALDPSRWGSGNADPNIGKSMAAELMMSDDLKPAATKLSAEYDNLASAGSSKVKGLDKTTYIARRLSEADPALLGVPEQPPVTLTPEQASSLRMKTVKAGADLSGLTKKDVEDAVNARRKLQLAGEDVSGLMELENRPDAFAKWSQSKLDARTNSKASAQDIAAAQADVAAANDAAAANRRGETYLRMMDPNDASIPVSSDFKLSPDAMMEAAGAASERAKAGDYSGMGVLGRAFKDPKLALAVVGLAGNDDLPLAQKRAAIADLVKQAKTAATPEMPELPAQEAPSAPAASGDAGTAPAPSAAEQAAPAAPSEAQQRSDDIQAILTSNEPEIDRARLVLDEAWDDPKLKEYLSTVEGVDPKDLEMATRQSLLKGAQKLTNNARDRISKQLAGHLPDLQKLFR